MDDHEEENNPGTSWMVYILSSLCFIAIYLIDYLHRAGSLSLQLYGILMFGLFVLVIILGALEVHSMERRYPRISEHLSEQTAPSLSLQGFPGIVPPFTGGEKKTLTDDEKYQVLCKLIITVLVVNIFSLLTCFLLATTFGLGIPAVIIVLSVFLVSLWLVGRGMKSLGYHP